MVRNYKRKTEQKKWSIEDMRAAIEAVRNDSKSLRGAATTYGIPRPTLQRHLKDKVKTPGLLGRFRTVFDEEFEHQLVDHCLAMQKRFYGLSLKNLRKLAYDLADRNKLSHPFSVVEKMAGKDWVASFVRRHSELSLREPEATSLSRATGFNRVQVNRFFELLKEEKLKYNYCGDNIYNVDETGVSSVHKPGKIIAAKGQKQVDKMVSGERGKNITVVCCVSATGRYIPPMFVFPRARMNDRLMKDAPDGSVGYAQKSG